MSDKPSAGFKVLFVVLLLVSVTSLVIVMTPVPTLQALRKKEFYLGWTPQLATPSGPAALQDDEINPHVDSSPAAVGDSNETNNGVTKVLTALDSWWRQELRSETVWRPPSGFYAFSDGVAVRGTPCASEKIALVELCGDGIAWNEAAMNKLSHGPKGTGASLLAISYAYGEYVSVILNRELRNDLSLCLAGVGVQHLPASYAKQADAGASGFYLEASSVKNAQQGRSAIDTGLVAGFHTCLAVYR